LPGKDKKEVEKGCKKGLTGVRGRVILSKLFEISGIGQEKVRAEVRAEAKKLLDKRQEVCYPVKCCRMLDSGRDKAIRRKFQRKMS